MNSLVIALWLATVSDLPANSFRDSLYELLSPEDLKEIAEYEQTKWQYQSMLTRMLANESYLFRGKIPLAALAEAKRRVLELEMKRLNQNGILRL